MGSLAERWDALSDNAQRFWGISVLVVVFAPIVFLSSENRPNMPEEVQLGEIREIAAKKVFTVRFGSGINQRFFKEDSESGKLFRRALPSTIGANFWSAVLPIGSGGLKQVYYGYAIAQGTSTKFAWKRDLCKCGGDGGNLYIDNATNRSVSAKFGDENLPLIPPKSYGLAEVKPRDSHLTVVSEGKVIDELDIDIPNSNVVLFSVYNVASKNTYRLLHEEYRYEQ